MRRIVFVNRYYDPDVSATSQMLTGVATGVAANGACVEVITSRQLYTDPGARLPRSESRGGVTITRIGGTRFGRVSLVGRSVDYASFYVGVAGMLVRRLRRGDTVVAKTDPPLLSVVCAVCAKLKGAILINWLQDIFPEILEQTIGIRALRIVLIPLRWVRDASLRSAACNVAIGEAMHDYLLTRRVPARRLATIPNWADESIIYPIETSASSLRRRLGLGQAFVVGYFGNLGRIHEFATMLAAAEELRGRTDIVFLVVGGGAGASQLKDLASSRGLGNMIFESYQPREQLADALAAANVHLVSLAPAMEPFAVPSKLYGVLAAGRPAILCGAVDGEVARCLRRADAGHAVAAGDGPDLAAVIRALADGPAEAARLGRNARGAYLKSFTRAQAVIAWTGVLGSVRPGDRTVQPVG